MNKDKWSGLLVGVMLGGVLVPFAPAYYLQLASSAALGIGLGLFLKRQRPLWWALATGTCAAALVQTLFFSDFAASRPTLEVANNQANYPIVFASLLIINGILALAIGWAGTITVFAKKWFGKRGKSPSVPA